MALDGWRSKLDTRERELERERAAAPWRSAEGDLRPRSLVVSKPDACAWHTDTVMVAGARQGRDTTHTYTLQLQLDDCINVTRRECTFHMLQRCLHQRHALQLVLLWKAATRGWVGCQRSTDYSMGTPGTFGSASAAVASSAVMNLFRVSAPRTG